MGDFEQFWSDLTKALASDDFYLGQSFTTYLNRPEAERSGDEMDVVDNKVAEPLLFALGYTRSEFVYNRASVGGRRPDYLVRIAGYPRPPFVLEDKNTTEDLSMHLAQLEGYMLAHGTPLGLLLNGQHLRVYEMANGLPVLVAEVSLREFASLQRGESLGLNHREIEASLRSVFTRCHKNAFTGTAQLLEDLTKTRTGALHDEHSWPTQARINVRGPSDAEFMSGLINETRQLIGEIRWDVESQLTLRLKEYGTYRARMEGARQDFMRMRKALLDALLRRHVPDVSLAKYREFLERRFDQRHEGDLLVKLHAELLDLLNALPQDQREADDVVDQREALFSQPSSVTPLLRPTKKKATKLTTLPGDVLGPLEALTTFLEEHHDTRDDLRLAARDAIAAFEAYRAWQSRVSTLLLPGAEEERLRSEFASQTSYVLVVRMMLVRIVEDKGLMPRVFTNGGVALWFEQVEQRYLKYAQGRSTDFLLEMAYASAQHIYSAFYSDLRIFDWYQPDRSMVVRVLHRLAGYDLSQIDDDVIGHMYARYVQDEHKHETGMYYTPPEVVEYMLDGISFTGRDVIGQKILDPACGSGTFLVSAARRIVQAYRAHHGGNVPAQEAQVVIDAVRDSVHGLDLNPFACYLAETNLLIQVLDLVKSALDAGVEVHVERFNVHNTDTVSYDHRTRTALTAAFGAAVRTDRLPPAERIKGKLGEYASGFDVVVANPPYVRADENDEMVLYRKRVKDQHPLSMVRDTMVLKWDLFVPFIALGEYLLKAGGRLAIITSNSIENVGYAEVLRAQLAQNQLDEVSFFPGVKLFEDAAVHNTIFMLTKQAPGTGHETVRRWHNSKPPAVIKEECLRQADYGAQVFRQDLMTEAYYNVVPLGDVLYVSKGMVLHNEGGAFKKDDLILADKDAQHPVPYVEGEDLDAYFPTSYHYLEHGPGLRSPQQVSRATFPELYTRPKILRGETSDAVLDDGRVDGWLYCNHSVLVMVPWSSLAGVNNRSITGAVGDKTRTRPDLEMLSADFDLFYLLGILNSAYALDLLRKITVSGRKARFQPEDFKRLLIPAVSRAKQATIADRARELHELGRSFTGLLRHGWRLDLKRATATAPAHLSVGVPSLKLAQAAVRWGLTDESPTTPLEDLSVSADGLFRRRTRVVGVPVGTPLEALEWLQRQFSTLPSGTTFAMAKHRDLEVPATPRDAAAALLDLQTKEVAVRADISAFQQCRHEVERRVAMLYSGRLRRNWQARVDSQWSRLHPLWHVVHVGAGAKVGS